MNLNNLTTEEREQLEQYARSVKEITNEINSLLEKCGYKLKENNGNTNPTGKTNPDGNDVINLNAMAPKNQPNNHSTNLIKKVK
jgi:hypothetical protein